MIFTEVTHVPGLSWNYEKPFCIKLNEKRSKTLGPLDSTISFFGAKLFFLQGRLGDLWATAFGKTIPLSIVSLPPHESRLQSFLDLYELRHFDTILRHNRRHVSFFFRKKVWSGAMFPKNFDVWSFIQLVLRSDLDLRCRTVTAKHFVCSLRLYVPFKQPHAPTSLWGFDTSRVLVIHEKKRYWAKNRKCHQSHHRCMISGSLKSSPVLQRLHGPSVVRDIH